MSGSTPPAPAAGPAPGPAAAPVAGAVPPERSEALRRLQLLERALVASQTEVEFYFIHGAVLCQAFASEPGTARISAMFRPAAAVREAAREVAGAEELPEGWMSRAAREALGDGAGEGAYVDLPRVRAFGAPPEYVLAVKCAALGFDDDTRQREDVRYLLRALNLASADEALALVTGYFAERQLTPDIRARIQALVSGVA